MDEDLGEKMRGNAHHQANRESYLFWSKEQLKENITDKEIRQRLEISNPSNRSEVVTGTEDVTEYRKILALLALADQERCLSAIKQEGVKDDCLPLSVVDTKKYTLA